MPAVIRRLGTISFNGAADANGTRWGCTELLGWYDGPTMRQQTLALAGEHGEVLTENLYGSRHMVLRGWAVPGAAVTTAGIADTLNAQTDMTTADKTLYVDESPAKQVTVRRNGDVRMRLVDGADRAVEFEIPLIATDPRKYSQTLTSTVITVAAAATSNSATVPNAGSIRLYPERLVVAGTATAPITITIDGKDIVLSQGLGAGRYVIYPQTRRVLYGAVDAEVSHYDYVTSARWGTIAPGGTLVEIERSATTATLTFTVETRSAFI